jgi:hypothetical protein
VSFELAARGYQARSRDTLPWGTSALHPAVPDGSAPALEQTGGGS